MNPSSIKVYVSAQASCTLPLKSGLTLVLLVQGVVVHILTAPLTASPSLPAPRGHPGYTVLSSSAPLPHGRSSGPAMCPPTRRYPEGLDAPIELSAKVRGSRRARPLRASAAQRAGRGWCYSKITRSGERVLMPWSHRGRCLAMRPGCIRLSTCLDEPPVPPL